MNYGKKIGRVKNALPLEVKKKKLILKDLLLWMLKELFKNLRAVESFSKTAKGQGGNCVACSSFYKISIDGKNLPWLQENP